ncbi:MAG TPA: bifunctional DNA-binding transcriptional regulator/O6-methylguanine-DNA methyltransferase Ada [Chloroflexota bacterium]|nr:bifunctional DNA-binding transcriptional regulator/O6-methylguanine-DNA methyltransferase Ada [Chloroflexota bacterium]
MTTMTLTELMSETVPDGTIRAPGVASGGGAFATDADRWAAVVGRDASAEGTFLYAVRTTGVYCRPTCHSRLPRRENVRFFLSSADAERAGFRACKRCAPDAAGQPAPHAAAVATACRRIEAADVEPTLGELAAEAGLSPFHFQRVFKRTTGVTPKQYAVAQRERRLRDGLRSENAGANNRRATDTRGTETVTGTIYDAGYGSGSRAYAAAPAALGMTPAAYRDGAPGEVVRYGTAPCMLGTLLVGTTDRGICAIELGDDADTLVARLARRFPKAQLEKGSRGFDATLRAVVALVETPRVGLALPLDIRGTAFQRRVWDVLRRLPPGTTATYGEIAARLGQPTAARAVAQACGANALAVAIPCHRVVASGGSLGGYRWGVERKRTLLEREATDGRRSWS